RKLDGPRPVLKLNPPPDLPSHLPMAPPASMPTAASGMENGDDARSDLATELGRRRRDRQRIVCAEAPGIAGQLSTHSVGSPSMKTEGSGASARAAPPYNVARGASARSHEPRVFAISHLQRRNSA